MIRDDFKAPPDYVFFQFSELFGQPGTVHAAEFEFLSREMDYARSKQRFLVGQRELLVTESAALIDVVAGTDGYIFDEASLQVRVSQEGDPSTRVGLTPFDALALALPRAPLQKECIGFFEEHLHEKTITLRALNDLYGWMIFGTNSKNSWGVRGVPTPFWGECFFVKADVEIRIAYHLLCQSRDNESADRSFVRRNHATALALAVCALEETRRDLLGDGGLIGPDAYKAREEEKRRILSREERDLRSRRD